MHGGKPCFKKYLKLWVCPREGYRWWHRGADTVREGCVGLMDNPFYKAISDPDSPPCASRCVTTRIGRPNPATPAPAWPCCFAWPARVPWRRHKWRLKPRPRKLSPPLDEQALTLKPEAQLKEGISPAQRSGSALFFAGRPCAGPSGARDRGGR